MWLGFKNYLLLMILFYNFNVNTFFPKRNMLVWIYQLLEFTIILKAFLRLFYVGNQIFYGFLRANPFVDLRFFKSVNFMFLNENKALLLFQYDVILNYRLSFLWIFVDFIFIWIIDHHDPKKDRPLNKARYPSKLFSLCLGKPKLGKIYFH